MTWAALVGTDVIGPATPLGGPPVNPGDAQWWWEYGLDGILGGALTGLIAVWGVRASLKHERKMSAEVELRTAVLRLRRVSAMAAVNAPQVDSEAHLIGSWAGELFEPLTEVQALSVRPAPRLCKMVQELESEFGAMMIALAAARREGETPFPNAQARAIAGRLENVTVDWLMNPKKYRFLIKKMPTGD